MPIEHPWDVTLEEARALQERLRTQVVEAPLPAPPRTVAGADISYDKHSPVLFAAFVVFDAATLEVVDVAGVKREATFPYVPGYLSFREVPPLLAAWEGLTVKPDLIVCDGQGRAHPRRFGLACHLGLWLDTPAFGCGKTRLCGTFEAPGPARGSHSPLVHRDEHVGEVVRTRDRVQPVYVSVGHRISLPEAVDWTLRLAPPYRQPLTTRAAHDEVNRLRRLG